MMLWNFVDKTDLLALQTTDYGWTGSSDREIVAFLFTEPTVPGNLKHVM